MFLKKIKSLEKKGHVISPISFPYLDYLVPTYYVLTTAEASSNLSRYDGVSMVIGLKLALIYKTCILELELKVLVKRLKEELC